MVTGTQGSQAQSHDRRHAGRSCDAMPGALEQGQPLVFADGSKGIQLGSDMKPKIVDVGDGDGQVPLDQLMGDAQLRKELGAAATQVAERFGVATVMADWDDLLAVVSRRRAAPA